MYIDNKFWAETSSTQNSTLELHPLVFILLNAEEKSSINYFSNNIGFENEDFTLKNLF
jgi:hypothetical protein